MIYKITALGLKKYLDPAIDQMLQLVNLHEKQKKKKSSFRKESNKFAQQLEFT